MATAAQRLVTEAALATFAGGHWISGNGSPEGVVTADTATIYVDMTASSATNRVVYVKTSGSTVNTGWQIIMGLIKRALAPANTSGGSLELLIMGGDNALRFSGLVPSAAGTVELIPANGALLNLAGINTFHGTVPTGTAGASRRLQLESTGRLVLLQASTSDNISGIIRWPREKTLPTTLPGTAA